MVEYIRRPLVWRIPVMTFERPQIIRPPSEASSYFLPLTSGCSNNTCTFCNYYYGSKLQVRELDDVKREIDALAFMPEAEYVCHLFRISSTPSPASGTANGSFSRMLMPWFTLCRDCSERLNTSTRNSHLWNGSRHTPPHKTSCGEIPPSWPT